MPTFPGYAKILRDGFSEQRESGLLRTEMESGPPKQARVKTRVMVSRPVKIMVNSLAEYQSFMDWYANDLEEGALWFLWDDPVSKSVKTVRFVGSIDATPLAAVDGYWLVGGLKIEGWGV